VVAVFALLPGWVQSPDNAGGEGSEASGDPNVPGTSSPNLPIPKIPGTSDSGALGTGSGDGVVGSDPGEDPETSRARAAERLRARRMLEELAARVVSLERRAVAEWGGADWQRTTAEVEAGRTHFEARRWQAALEAWQRAGTLVDRLQASLPSVRDGALSDGDAALAAGDAGRAEAAYGLAATLDPRSSRALAGLERARVWDQVQDLVADARNAEARGDFRSAAELYGRALRLDAASGEAQSGQGRARARLVDAAFGRAMSRGFDALEARRFGDARQLFSEAGGLHPGSTDAQASVRDALSRVDSAEKLWRVGELRTEAEELEAGERWRQAAARFEAVLELDAAVAFARDGLRRATERGDMAEALDFHLGNGARMSEAAVLEEASRLLDRARQVEPAGPRHRAQTASLAKLLETYSEPVEARFVSDSQTEVVIYKVGRLGRFDQRTLELRPGRYTVTGRRAGYRDVRMELVVEPGVIPEPMVVACDEVI
ncbi:MAG: hypothetical protein MI919_30445, partial [Holophagales bacterium]|nr:hypothetical protein [Holophagales bacterium]